MRVKACEFTHCLLHKLERTERLRLLEVWRRKSEERRVVHTVRVLKLKILVYHGKQLISDLPVSDLVFNQRLEVIKLDVALSHGIKLSHDLFLNGCLAHIMEHIVKVLNRLRVV